MHLTTQRHKEKLSSILHKRNLIKYGHTIPKEKCDRILYFYRINYGGRTELVLQTPKSECSLRDLPLTAKMLSLLRPLRTKPENYILTGCSKPMEPRTLQYRFRRFQLSLDIPTRNYHVFRHFFATRCIERGMDAKTLSEILGHANVKTTLQMYTQPSMQSKRRLLEAASAMSGIA